MCLFFSNGGGAIIGDRAAIRSFTVYILHVQKIF